MLKKIAKFALAIVALVLVSATAAYVATQPDAPPPDSTSAAWLEDGPFEVGEVEIVFTDTGRPTQANGDYPGSDARTLDSSMWYPVGASGAHPLVVYSHGFMSNRQGGAYMAANLASHGYVVISADYPLTHTNAPGGPRVTDVVHQPGDVSFLIDSVLALGAEDRPFDGSIDAEKIGVAGISLGGLTSTLAAYHPRMRDKRVRAAISIAGPANMFTPAYFAHADVPFLMIAGDVDAIVDYAANAASVPERVEDGALLSIAGGAHTSFVDLAEPSFRFMDNPDSLGCTAILANVPDAGEAEPEEPVNVFTVLGDERDGIVFEAGPPLCGQSPLPEAIHPGRQQMITQLGVLSFFQAQFANDPQVRAEAKELLSREIAADFAEASFRG